MEKNNLSIYLIKEGIEDEKIFDEENYNIKILKEYDENKKIFFAPTYVHEPSWVTNFFELKCEELKQANSRAVLIDKINIKGKEIKFAVVFGYAKNLFATDVLEEQFGLKIVLNTVNVNSIRKISKLSIGGNLKQSQEQMPKTSNINEFGFDLDRDLIRYVTAKCEDEIFAKANITGGDIFSLQAEININNIDGFLVNCYNRYCENKYQKNFEWIDNIKEVKSNNEKDKLNKELLDCITKEKWDCVWMAVPEIIHWEEICGFKYEKNDELFDDIFIDKFIDSLKNKLENIEQLKRKKIYMFDNNREEIRKWNAFSCINTEIEIDKNMYCLNNGKWYYINKDFSEKIEKEYESINISKTDFIEYSKEMKNEDDYNEALSNYMDSAYLIHKIGEVTYGGGTGNKIEVCDVMTKSNKLIHIKKNGGSSYLSHLFNQATVSSELLLDENFRKKVNEKMKQQNFNKEFPNNFKANDYTIIIGIINKYDEERPKIPFFSKVAIRYTIRRMNNLGYNVELKNIKIN